ncbi:unnamed protein product [Blepharisma stoltei]|uniref:Protein TIC 214 n=1 Tax=Blepharisma stoltei TaxID=1481888 RepID=A0AAU9JGR8_9CILI|nr:unnamed protein product [Blepharisma stoltei]
MPTSILKKFDNNYELSLGPGSYRSATPTPGPAYQFDTSPRLASPIEHQLSSVLIRYSGSKQKFANRDISARDISLHTRKKKNDLLKEKSQQRLIDAALTKKTKEFIQIAKHENLVKSLEEKYAKYEFRRNRKEILQIKQNWGILFIIIASSWSWRQQFNKHKRFKEKVNFLGKWFTIMCLIIGKIRLRCKMIKNREAWNALRSKMTRYIRNWKLNRKNKQSQIMVNFLDWSLSHAQAYQIIKRFRKKIILIQKSLKSMKLIHKARIDTLMLLWSKTEPQIEIDPKKKQNINNQFVPEKIKLHYLKPYLLKKLKEFSKEISQHFRMIKSREIELSMQKHMYEIERAVTGKKFNIRNLLPKRPRFILYTCKIELKDVIKNALKDKDDWSTILGTKVNDTKSLLAKQFSIASAESHKVRKRSRKKKKIVFEDIEIATRSRSRTIRNNRPNQILPAPSKALFSRYEVKNAIIEESDPSFQNLRGQPTEASFKESKMDIEEDEDFDFNTIRVRQRSRTRR